ncbi:RnfABCDGE type electron transport complex subunit D [Candidatus Roizmanbacteria bacterium]|nr:RnfABCDGE type electron transport complex subunit D [Candidatus Roizmanbacteria bacterium]
MLVNRRSLTRFLREQVWNNRWRRIPKMQMAGFLALIALSAAIFSHSISALTVFILSIGSVLFFEYCFLRIRRVKPFLLSASIVTGLIIGLLTSPFLPWYVVIIAALIAVFSKQFIRLNKQHIFNPAAFGLFSAGLLFHYDISWWAVSFQSWPPHNFFLAVCILILILPGYVSGVYLRRYGSILAFLIVYIFLKYKLTHQATVVGLYDPTVIFFSLVMLPEPMTTPRKLNRQPLFGSVVALISFLPLMKWLPDPLLTALLFANGLFFKFR